MTSTFKSDSAFLGNAAAMSFSNSQSQPSVTALADGRYVVSWTEGEGNSGLRSVRAQIFNADGSDAAPEFLVSDHIGQTDSVIAAFADGRFVVSWTDHRKDDDDVSAVDVWAQVFDGDGVKSGAEFLVNTSIVSIQWSPSVTTLSDGRFVVSWTDWSRDQANTPIWDVRAQIFNADGSKAGTEILVNVTDSSFQGTSAITALSDGRFVATWTDKGAGTGEPGDSSINAQIFDADGNKSGPEFLVTSPASGFLHNSTITTLSDGRFVVSWIDFGDLRDGVTFRTIQAQIFEADGSKSGSEFQVNNINNEAQSAPSVTALADGRFVVSWVEWDESMREIRAQVFNADGSKAGDGLSVTIEPGGRHLSPSVAGLADGRFVISWRADEPQDSDGSTHSTIQSQIFDPRESAVTIAGSRLDDDFIGTRYGDDIAGLFGDDHLVGGRGDDDLSGQRGDDVLKGNTGDDVLKGNTGDDRLHGGAGNDILNGGFGLDYMVGGKGDDIYVVDQAGDVVMEKSDQGIDTIRSSFISLDLAYYANIENLKLTGQVALNLTGNAERNVLTGNANANVLSGLGGRDVIRGGGSGDNISGGSGADRLFGQSGRDLLWGGADNDILNGGLDRDIMNGGTGADRFVFNSQADTGNSAGTRDRITDFSQAQGDRIDLSGIDADLGAGNQAFTFIGDTAFSATSGELRFIQRGDKTIVQGDINGDGVKDFEIALDGLHALLADDFIL